MVMRLSDNHYYGALRHGPDENNSKATILIRYARTLIEPFTSFADMILRFAVDRSHQLRCRGVPAPT